jgi:hypothetical protein
VAIAVLDVRPAKAAKGSACVGQRVVDLVRDRRRNQVSELKARAAVGHRAPPREDVQPTLQATSISGMTASEAIDERVERLIWGWG